MTRYSPSFLVNKENECKERGNRSFLAVPPAHRETVEAMFEMVCNTWEMTSIPFPNRTMRPGESWLGRVPSLVNIDGKRHTQWMYIVCTYEGVRESGGRTEAFVRLSGQVRGTGALADEELGTISGRVLIDVNKGMISQVKVTVRSEIVVGDADVRITFTDDSIIERVEGNTQGIKEIVRP